MADQGDPKLTDIIEDQKPKLVDAIKGQEPDIDLTEAASRAPRRRLPTR